MSKHEHKYSYSASCLDHSSTVYVMRRFSRWVLEAQTKDTMDLNIASPEYERLPKFILVLIKYDNLIRRPFVFISIQVKVFSSMACW